MTGEKNRLLSGLSHRSTKIDVTAWAVQFWGVTPIYHRPEGIMAALRKPSVKRSIDFFTGEKKRILSRLKNMSTMADVTASAAHFGGLIAYLLQRRDVSAHGAFCEKVGYGIACVYYLLSRPCHTSSALNTINVSHQQGQNLPFPQKRSPSSVRTQMNTMRRCCKVVGSRHAPNINAA